MEEPIERYGWAIITPVGFGFSVHWLDRGRLRKAGASSTIEGARVIARAHAEGAPVTPDLFGGLELAT